MGRAARQKALRDFDQQRVIDLTLDTYYSLLSQRVPASPDLLEAFSDRSRPAEARE
jgi:hypothetical protein